MKRGKMLIILAVVVCMLAFGAVTVCAMSVDQAAPEEASSAPVADYVAEEMAVGEYYTAVEAR